MAKEINFLDIEAKELIKTAAYATLAVVTLGAVSNWL
jgi:hypothetical protein|tara:strand:- start:174 stop:284 length:111 start_codon:yes stop_codon:yes gene_type:complete